MAIGRWKDKEVVVHISSGILLSYKKKCIWISCNDVDEPRAYCTELSKSERERQILYNNAYTLDLEGWYQRSYAQGSKRGTDVRNRLWTLWEKERAGWFERIALNLNITIHRTNGQCKFEAWSRTSALWQPGGVGCGGRCRGVQKRRTRASPRLIHAAIWQKPSQCCKVILLQLK